MDTSVQVTLTERSAKAQHALILGFVIDGDVGLSSGTRLDEVNGRRRLQRREELGSIPSRLVLQEEVVSFEGQQTIRRKAYDVPDLLRRGERNA